MSSIIANWEKEGRKWNWNSLFKHEERAIPAGRERVLAKIVKGNDGVVFPSSAQFSAPDMGIRIKTDQLDTEFEYTAENLYQRGELNPNNSFYCPYYSGQIPRYVVSFNDHLPFQKNMVISLFNSGTVSGDVEFYHVAWAYVLEPLKLKPRT